MKSPESEMAKVIARRLRNKKYRLFLFGSRARGEAFPYSDYDLAILAQKPIPLATISALRGDLEALPLLQKIDLVDLKAASSALKYQILKYGQLLDEPGGNVLDGF